MKDSFLDKFDKVVESYPYDTQDDDPMYNFLNNVQKIFEDYRIESLEHLEEVIAFGTIRYLYN